jgi:AcrR family transcriptional regulator
MHEDRKSTQRQRLLDAMMSVAVREGYAATTIAKVIAEAGVSRPTFYEHFSDKDDCFLAAHREIAGRVLEQIRRDVAQAPPEQAPQSAVGALLRFADTEPTPARLLMCEALAAGPRALDERDSMIGAIERIIERARADTPPQAPSPDLPTWALIGAIHWLLATRLRRGEGNLGELADELRSWIDSYQQPAGEHRWHTIEPGPTPPPSPYPSELPRSAPPPLPPGRSSRSHKDVAHNQRERILYATAEVAARYGYNAATIAEITTSAGVDRRGFNGHFPDKQQAFLAAHELGFQHTMAVAARAFFSVATWPERAWQGILAGTQFQASYPTITHLTYVQSYAIGAPAIERIEESHAAFTIFLQEGNQNTPHPQPQSALEAIVAASFEIVYHQSRCGHGEEMPRLAWHLTYLCLAPFLEPDAANAFIDGKLEASGLRAASLEES